MSKEEMPSAENEFQTVFKEMTSGKPGVYIFDRPLQFHERERVPAPSSYTDDGQSSGVIIYPSLEEALNDRNCQLSKLIEERTRSRMQEII